MELHPIKYLHETLTLDGYPHLADVVMAASVEPVQGTVHQLFPDLPQAAIHYFPDRPGDKPV